jgi:hypothetical protein
MCTRKERKKKVSNNVKILDWRGHQYQNIGIMRITAPVFCSN